MNCFVLEDVNTFQIPEEYSRKIIPDQPSKIFDYGTLYRKKIFPKENSHIATRFTKKNYTFRL